MCCQLEVYVTGRSLVQRSSTDCGVSLCVVYKPQARAGLLRQREKKRLCENNLGVSCTHTVLRKIMMPSMDAVEINTIIIVLF